MYRFSLHLLLLYGIIVPGCTADTGRPTLHDSPRLRDGHSVLVLSDSENAGQWETRLHELGVNAHTRIGHPEWIDEWMICWDEDATGETGWVFENDPSRWSHTRVGRSWRRNNRGYTGAGWYRRSFRWKGRSDVTPALVLRSMEDSVTVYLNEAPVFSGGGDWADVEVELGNARAGENTLHIRVLNSPSAGDPSRGGLAGPADVSVALDEGDLLETYDMLILPSPLLMSWYTAHSIREYVKHGGTVIAVFHDDAEKWEHLPLEELLPTRLGYPREYKRRLTPVIHPEWLPDFDPDLPPMDVIPCMNLPAHPRFSRPGTQNLERWQPSPLAWNHEVIIWGNDGCETPIFSRCDFGSGEVYACYAADLLVSDDARPVLRRILSSLHPRSRTETPALGGIWSVGPVPWDKLNRMGCEYAERPQADLLIVAESSDHAMAAMDSALSEGQQILVLDPDIFSRKPALDPWRQGNRGFPSRTPIDPYRSSTPDGRTVSVSTPEAYEGYTVCIENDRYGPVRGTWFETAVHQCVDGSWIVTPSPANGNVLRLGLWWNEDRQAGTIHWGDRGVLETSSGFSLRQSMSRPFWREPREEVIWRWQDGLPAVAAIRHARGRIIAPAVPFETVDPRSFSWSDATGNKDRYLEEDTETLIALLARELVTGHVLQPYCRDGTADSWTVHVPLHGNSPDSLFIRVRLMDWQRSQIFAGEYLIPPADTDIHTISLPWPDNPPGTTGLPLGMEAYYWARVAVLGSRRDRCLGWIEQSIHPPRPRFQLWHTPIQRRRPPHEHATWPRFSEEGFPAGWGPASQYPLFSAGDSIELFVETYAMETPARPTVTIRETGSGTVKYLKPVTGRHQTVPWNVYRYPPFILQRSGTYLIEAAADTFVSSRRIHVPDTSRGMRDVIWDRHKGVQVLGSLYPHVDGAEFTRENGVGDPRRGIPWGMFSDTWPGQPWCNFHPNPHCLLPNGLHYRTCIASTIRDLSTHVWTGERMVISASLVDGFNGVLWPEAAVHPQHLMVFVDWLSETCGYDIPEMTVDSLAAFVQDELDPQWRRFVAEEISLRGHEIFREELKAASPRSQVTDQCDLPQLPTLLRIPDVEEFALRWQRVFDISSMDAWNVRAGRTFRASTYLGCLGKALAPTMKFGHFHMEMLGGDGPERISQLTRMYRQNADLLWMSVADTSGKWIPVVDYPNGGGVSWLGGWEHWLGVSSRGIRGGHTAYHEDYGGLMHLFAIAEAHRPVTPRGFVFAAVGPRTPVIGERPVIVGDQARLFSLLREGGLPLSAVARIDFLSRESLPDGLIVPLPGDLSPREKRTLSWFITEQKPVGIVACGSTDEEISRFTGISPADLRSGHVSILRGGNITGPFWDDGTPEAHPAIRVFIGSCGKSADFAIPPINGVSAYAFEGTDGLYIILEENLGRSREIRVPVRSSFPGLHAEELLFDMPVVIHSGDDGFVVEFTIPASTAVCIRITG